MREAFQTGGATVSRPARVEGGGGAKNNEDVYASLWVRRGEECGDTEET